MKITKKSMISGKIASMELDITPEQLAEYTDGQKLIQHIFPNLNADEREFLMSGITPTEWNEAFGEEE